MLLSWAAKKGWKPTFVDLDIGQGAITIPGCIAATPIEMPIDPVEGFPTCITGMWVLSICCVKLLRTHIPIPVMHIPVMHVGNPSQIPAGSTMEEEGGRYKSPPAAHKSIFHLLNILGVLLQVKHATADLPSPFVTDHNTVVMLIADLLTYAGTLQTANILQASNNTNIYELMNNISLLCGNLALVLLVLLLIPAFGWFTLACWTLYFVIIMTKSFQILRGLCTAAVGYVRDKKEELMRRLNGSEEPQIDEATPTHSL